jgi:putative flavoprotein involved in K+ transport
MLATSSFAPTPEVLDALVVGAGQAGLAAGYYLQQAGASFIILETAPAVGHSWTARYDSLRLFSPAWTSGLPGYPWPGNPLRYPTKNEVAAYLAAHAAHFRLPVELNETVTSVTSGPARGYLVRTASGREFATRRVIFSTGAYTQPKVPAFATTLPATVQQLTSHAYQRPAQLSGKGPVAVVGSGNSALQIAADLAATGRPVFVAFDEQTPAMPNNTLMWLLLRLTGLLAVPCHTWLGKWMHRQPEPVVSGDLARLRRFANVQFMGRAESALPDGLLVGQRAATPVLQAVVWATGYRPAYDFIDLPVFDAAGQPQHQRGLTALPGVAFLGLNWLDSRRSALLHGAGPDARRVVTALLRQMP